MGSRVSPSTISDLNQKIFSLIEEWRTRPLEPKSPYIFVDGIWLKRSWGGEVQNVSVLVAIGVSTSGFREIVGAAEGSREDAESWRQFLRYLLGRGLEQIDLVVSDKNLVFWRHLENFTLTPNDSVAWCIFIATCCMRFHVVKPKKLLCCLKLFMPKRIKKPHAGNRWK